MVSSGMEIVRAPNLPLWRVERRSKPAAGVAWVQPALGRGRPSGEGHRFDHATAGYVVVYYATDAYGAFLETLAPLRPKLTAVDFDLGAELDSSWRTPRVLIEATLSRDAVFLDVEHVDTRTGLERELRMELAALNVTLLNIAAIRGADRRVTRTVSQWAWQQPGFAGIRYLSQYDSTAECWAVFDRTPTTIIDEHDITATDTQLARAARYHHLTIT